MRTPAPSNPRKHWGLNLVLLGISCVIALGLAELAVRVVWPLTTVAYVADPEVGYMLVPNQQTRSVSEDFDVPTRTNSSGFHDVEHAVSKPSEVYRVVVLGDSYMEAIQVPIEEGFTQQLEHRLQKWVQGRRVEVIGLGISGTGPAQYYRVLDTKGLRYRPDLVLMAVLPDNDFRDSYQPLAGAIFKPYYEINDDGSLVLVPPQISELAVRTRSFLKKSAFLQLLRLGIARMSVEQRFAQLGLLAPHEGLAAEGISLSVPLDWHVYRADVPAPWPDAYRVTLRMIEEAAKLSARNEARFLVMTIGAQAAVESRLQEAMAPYPDARLVRWDFDRPFREIAALGDHSGFDVVNLLEPFRDEYAARRLTFSFAHDGHWTARGHQFAAEIVSSFLQEHRTAYGLN